MIKVDKAEGCNILFCFATDCRGISNEMISVAEKNNIKLNIEHTNKLGNLFVNAERLSSFSCVILQEYVDVMNPITSDFFINLSQILDVKLLCIFNESNRESYKNILYDNGQYNCFFGQDAENIDIEDFLNICMFGRTREEAEKYYNIKLINQSDEKINNICKILDEYKRNNISKVKFIKIIDSMSMDDYSKILLRVKNNDIKFLLESKEFTSFYNDFRSKFIVDNSIKKVKLIDRFFCREKKIKYLAKKNIAVVSASPGAGATFISTSLADIISKEVSVTYMEFPSNQSYMYYYLGYDVEPADECNMYKIIKENNLDSSDNFNFQKKHNIYWVVNTPSYKVNDWKVEDMLKLIYCNKSSDINILDVGYNMFEKSFIDIADQFYMIIVVVDSLIAKLFCDRYYLSMIKQYRKRFTNMKFVVNKYNSAVDDKQLKECLGCKADVYVESLDYKYLCDAVYNFKLATCHKNVFSTIEKSFKSILKDLYK